MRVTQFAMQQISPTALRKLIYKCTRGNNIHGSKDKHKTLNQHMHTIYTLYDMYNYIKAKLNLKFELRTI